MKLGKILNEHWSTFWQVLFGLVLVGGILLLLEIDFGWALIGIPVFALIAGYFFKSSYVKGQKK